MNARVPVVVVHGGAGDVPEDRRPMHAAGCARAAQLGIAALRASGDPVEAVLAAVSALEGDPLFNAGTGACLTAEGTLELDASVMAGADLGFGGVASLPPFASPIRVADAVRRDGRHTLYAGDGAARFAIAHGFSPSEPEAMITDAARERLAATLAGRAGAGWAGGTVGAVACDARGRVAAATSTGGTVGKIPGRVGDTPLPGAGTYADDRAGACSTTGIGEHIMRFALAQRVCGLLAAGVPAQAAADAMIAAFGARIAGRGGLILVSPDGDVGIAKNTETMSWAIARGSSEDAAHSGF